VDLGKPLDVGKKRDRTPYVENEMLELSALLFEHVEGQLARADEKAELAITATAILIAAATFSNSEMFLIIIDSSVPPTCRLSALFSVLMLVALFGSLYYAFHAVIPRLTPPVKDGNPFYFNSIIQYEEGEFIESFENLDDTQARLKLLSEIHAKSKIAHQKYTQLRRSYVFLVIAFILWGLSQLTYSCP
jgi:hypothetical protein